MNYIFQIIWLPTLRNGTKANNSCRPCVALMKRYKAYYTERITSDIMAFLLFLKATNGNEPLGVVLGLIFGRTTNELS